MSFLKGTISLDDGEATTLIFVDATLSTLDTLITVALEITILPFK